MSMRLLSPPVGAAGAEAVPGSAVASLRNSALMLKPALADVSINRTPSSRAFLSPSSVETCLRSAWGRGVGRVCGMSEGWPLLQKIRKRHSSI